MGSTRAERQERTINIGKKTAIGRRKRFRSAVDELPIDSGWQTVRANVYAPPREGDM